MPQISSQLRTKLDGAVGVSNIQTVQLDVVIGLLNQLLDDVTL